MLRFGKSQLSAISLLLIPCGFAESKVFKNFTLIDGSGSQPIANMSMLVSEGKIAFLGPAAKFKVPSGVAVIDLSGKFVMPGIINLHGHVGATQGMEQGPQFYSRESVERDLQTYAAYGVTTVVSLGTDPDVAFDVRDRQRGTRPHMARLYTAGEGFTLKGGNPPDIGLRHAVATAEECEPILRELAARDADFVKIWVDDAFAKRKKMPIELSRAIIASARKHGLRTVVHIVDLKDGKELVEAGAAGLAHSVRDQPVDGHLIGLMKTHDAWQMAATLTREASTFVYADNPAILDDPFLSRSAPTNVIATLKSLAYRDQLRADPEFHRYPRMLELAGQNLKRLANAGVKYGLGTDSGPPARFQGYFEHWEMELMVKAGLTPAQVIKAATKSGAEFLGARDLGTLERGKWADLIVLNKNPLSNIRNTRSIESVYIAGNVVPRT